MLVNSSTCNSVIFPLYNLYDNTKIINNTFIYSEDKIFNEKMNYNYESFRHIIEYGFIEKGNIKIRFDDNIWKLPETKYEYNQRNISIFFPDDEDGMVIKLYAYALIIYTNNTSKYIRNKINTAKHFLEIAKIHDYDFYKSNEMCDCYCKLKKKENLSFHDQIALKSFIEFLHNELNVKVNKIDQLYTTIKDNFSKTQYKLLDIDFYVILCKTLKEDIYNDNLPVNNRIKFSIFYLSACLGLRISEIVNISRDCIKTNIHRNYPDKRFLVYHSTKNSSKKAKSVYYPLSEELANDIEYIKKLSDDSYPTLLPNLISRKNTYSISYLEKSLILYCFAKNSIFSLVNYENGSQTFNGQMTKQQLYSLGKDRTINEFELNKMNDQDIFYYPTFHQFRVYCISQYASAGVTIPELAKIFNHLNPDETSGYYRAIVKRDDNLLNS